MNVKVPPQDIQSEMALIAGMLSDSSIVKQVAGTLSADDFYREANTRIVEGIFELKEGADLVTLHHWLTSKGILEKIGGEAYLSKFPEAFISAGWKYHAEIVKGLSDRRRIINLCSMAHNLAFLQSNEQEEILSALKAGIRDIEAQRPQELTSNRQLYDQIYTDLWDNKSEPGLTFGIGPIDRCHYLERGCTLVVAGESGTGKSALCLQIADHVANKYGTTLYFTMESTRIKLGVRQLARHSKVALTRLHKRNLDGLDSVERINNAMGDLTQSPLILIDDSRFQEIERLVSYCETRAMGEKIHLIVVDYLQLLSSKKGSQNRHLEISDIAKRFNFLAKNLNIPVIYVSQLGKDVEKRTNRRPGLGDLKESGDIRNHADNILFLYALDSSPTVYPIEAFLGKGKDQEQFSIWLEFNGNYQEFREGVEPEIKVRPRKSEHWQDEV